jgi:hypothetical protein
MKKDFTSTGEIIKIDTILSNDENYLSIIGDEIKEKISGMFSVKLRETKTFAKQLDSFIVSVSNKIFQMRSMFIDGGWFPDTNRDVFSLAIVFRNSYNIDINKRTMFAYTLKNSLTPVTSVYDINLKPIKELEQYTKNNSETELEFIVSVLNKNKRIADER